MGSSAAAVVWKDVVGRRWITCALWQGVLASAIWLLLEVTINRISRSLYGAEKLEVYLPHLWTGLRFMSFLASQGFFLLGQTFISDPEERDAASLGDLASGLLKAAVSAVVGRPQEESSKIGIPGLKSKIRTTFDFVSFAAMTSIAGFLAMISLTSSVQVSLLDPGPVEIGLRGAALGLLYAGVQFYQKNLSLVFPILQRGLFFGLKMGVPSALRSSVKLAFAFVPVGEAVSWTIVPSANAIIAHSAPVDRPIAFLLWRQSLFAITSFFIAFSWEFGHHIVQILQTKHHIFAPPLGSAAAEADSTDLLLMVLEDPETPSLVRYHAFHDLCIVSETNVDTWRRAAFFEETGDAYRRLITICLKRLDNLTIRLAQHLEGFQADKGVDFLRRQMQSPQFDNQPAPVKGAYMQSHFRDFQLCVWCARIVASLTACSRFEDRYGVAQLHGCNVDVVSSLLSCLLVVEVYLGRKSNTSGVNFVPNTIKWTVPSKSGAFMDGGGKRQGTPFGKRTVMYKRAYALADVLRTSLYQIVSVFGDEMVQVTSSGSGYIIAERDWLSRQTPLFGAYEMHLQKLGTFLEYCVG